MGLVLKPAELKNAAQQMRANIADSKTGYSNALQVIGRFAENEQLDSQSWSTAKFNMSTAHQLITQGMQAAQEAIEQDLSTLETSVGDKELDEDQLIEDIEKLTNECICYEEAIRNLQRMAARTVFTGYAGIQTAINRYKQLLEQTKAILEIKKEELNYLIETSQMTAELLSSSGPLLQAIECAINDAEVYITGTGTFSNGEWRITISEIIKENFQSYEFKYDWAKVEISNSELVTPEFLNKVVEISNELQIDPDDLMAVMAFESRFNPQEKNSTGAVGLIQFTGMAIKYINQTYGTEYTKDQIEKMDSLEQLDLVYLFYKEKTGNMYDVGDVYLVTFAPSFVDGIEKRDDVILYSKDDPKHPEYYENNKGLDKENKGYITKGDACAAVLERRKEYEY